MKYDICCIGHITHDHIETPDHHADLPGGTVWYFANAMARIGAERFLAVTSVGAEDMESVERLRRRGVETRLIPSRKTVFFENIYGEDSNDRRQRVLEKADPFGIADLEGIEATVFHLGYLLADDFEPGVIEKLSERGKVSIDVQGLLRHVEGDRVLPSDWEDKIRLLPYIDTLKANEHEMYALTGTTDPFEAGRILEGYGVRESVLTLGDRGSLIYVDGKAHRVEAIPVGKVTDATGCGDTYMAVYLRRRLDGKSPEESGREASELCSLKVCQSGPL